MMERMFIAAIMCLNRNWPVSWTYIIKHGFKRIKPLQGMNYRKIIIISVAVRVNPLHYITRSLIFISIITKPLLNTRVLWCVLFQTHLWSRNCSVRNLLHTPEGALTYIVLNNFFNPSYSQNEDERHQCGVASCWGDIRDLLQTHTHTRYIMIHSHYILLSSHALKNRLYSNQKYI